MSKRNSDILLLIVLAGWVAAWFWVFSFGYSNGFFRYHLETRIPFLILSLIAVSVAPVSTFLCWRRYAAGRIGRLRTLLTNLGITLVPLAMFWLSFLALRFVPGPMAGHVLIEADEAMGIGIDFGLCVGVVLIFNILLAIAVAIRRPR